MNAFTVRVVGLASAAGVLWASTATAQEPAMPTNAQAVALAQEPGGQGPRSASGDQLSYTGALRYEYTIPLPPGRRGMWPRLSFLYNSQAARGGEFGAGWSLSLPSIERKANRGSTAPGPVNYAGTDFLFRVGDSAVELVRCLPAGACPGVPEANEYRLKVDDGSHLRFFFDGTAWAAYDKEGVQHVYGADAAARQDNPAKPSEVFRWCLQRSVDTAGNAVLYTYKKVSGNGAIRVESVEYTARVTDAGTVLERGGYVVKLGATSLAPVRYDPGFHVLDPLIDSVEVWQLGPDGQPKAPRISRTELQLGAGGAIHRYGATSTERLPDLTFQEVGPARAETTWAVQGGVAFKTSTGAGRVVTGDFNGDGRTDIARIEAGRSYWEVSLSTGSGFTTSKWYLSAVFSSEAWVVRTGDFDGDGLTDILTAPAGSTQWRVALSLGTTFQESTWASDPFVIVGSPTAADYTVQVGDFDGDGRSDLAYAVSGTPYWKIARSTGNGFATKTWPQYSDPAFGTHAALLKLADGLEAAMVADFDGNGRADILWNRSYATACPWIFPSAWHAYLTSPDAGTFDGSSFSGLGPPMPDGGKVSVIAGDFNGDGLSDLTFVSCGRVASSCWANTPRTPSLPGGMTEPGCFVWDGGETCEYCAGCTGSIGSQLEALNLFTLLAGQWHACKRCTQWDACTGNCTAISPMSDSPVVPGWRRGCTSKTYFSMGKHFDTGSPGAWSHPIQSATTIEPNAILVGDFMGTGALTMVEKANGKWFGFGGTTSAGFGGAEWATACDPGYTIVGDFNGSGRADLACAMPGATAWTLFLDSGSRTVTIGTGLGGSTTYTLQSVAFQNPDPTGGLPPTNRLRYPVEVVVGASSTDGMGGVSFTGYSYAGSYWSADREFRGFRKVTATLPDFTKHAVLFHQDTAHSDPLEEADFKGRPQREESFSAQGNLLSRTDYRYTRNGLTAGTYPTYALLDTVTRTTYLGGLQATAAKQLGYDAFGNLRWSEASGTGVAKPQRTDLEVIQIAGLRSNPRRIAHRVASQSLGETLGVNQYSIARKVSMAYFAVGTGEGREGNLRSSTGVYCSLLSPTDPRGQGCADPVTEYDYTGDGNVSSVKDPKGQVTTTTYETTLRAFPEVVTSPKPTSSQSAHRVKTTYDYRFGLPQCVSDLDNGVDRCTIYDAFGRPTSATAKQGATLLAESTVDYRDIDKFGQYDAGGVPIAAAPPGSIKSSARLNKPGAADEWSETVEFLDGLGRTVQTTGRGETPAGGSQRVVVTQRTYDSMGRVVHAVGPFLATGAAPPIYPRPSYSSGYPWVVRHFDGDGQLFKVVQSDGETGSIALEGGFFYNTGPTHNFTYSGFSVKHEDPDHLQIRRTVDALGRTASVEEFDKSGTSRATTYSYAVDGQLASITDSSGRKVVEAQYDPLGRRRLLYDLNAQDEAVGDLAASRRPWEYFYDPNGNLDTVIEPSGQKVSFGYDALDRVLSKCYWDTGRMVCSRTTTFQYDLLSDPGGPVANGVGRLAAVSTGTVATRFRYDALGRVARSWQWIQGAPVNPNALPSENASEYRTEMEYDLGGRLRAVVYPDAYRVEYSYHPTTRLLSSVQGPAGALLAQFGSYDPAGQLGVITSPKTTTQMLRDPWSGRLQGIKTVGPTPGQVIADTSLRASPGGRLVNLFDLKLGAQLGATTTPPYVQWSYAYDSQGRVQHETQSMAVPSDLSPGLPIRYDLHARRPHALASVGTVPAQALPIRYDLAGNTVSDYDLSNPAAPAQRQYSYDDTGLLFDRDAMPARITHATKGVTSFEYDAEGERAKKVGPAGTTWYLGPHFEIRNGVPTKYVFAGGMRLAMVTASGTKYFHKDHMGSTVAVTDATGLVLWSGSYQAYGALRTESGTRQSPYLFTDKELDAETGLYYFGARYYDPMLGRFTSPDSLVARPFDPQSLNTYAYAQGDPPNRVDPDGHDSGDTYGGDIVNGPYGTSPSPVSFTLTSGAGPGDIFLKLFGGGHHGTRHPAAIGNIGTNVGTHAPGWVSGAGLGGIATWGDARGAGGGRSQVLELYIRSFAPFRVFGSGFAGDAREFTTGLDVTSRMSGRVSVDLMSQSVFAPSAGSSRSSCVGGASVCSMMAWINGTEVMKEQPRMAVSGTTEGTLIRLSGSNPFFRGYAPDINLNLLLKFGAPGFLPIAALTGDRFPNSEVFIVGPKGAMMLIKYQTAAGPIEGPLFYLPGNIPWPMGEF